VEWGIKKEESAKHRLDKRRRGRGSWGASKQNAATKGGENFNTTDCA
jgi:hypothetical protein